MKTSVILHSSDRDLFGLKISQDTKTQFLSVTELQKAYEVARWKHGWGERSVHTVMQSVDFRERLFYILESKGLIELGITRFIEMIEKEGITRVLKGLGVWKSTGARGTNNVMCDPHVWVLLAMEMNPMIYAKVVIWLTDTLIFNRIEAGTEYLPMNTSIKSVIPNPDYGIYAKEINTRVFGHHQAGMRNLASASELRRISDIEKFVKNAIENGWIKSQVQILNAIKNYK
jgi:hypothetical protein